MGSVIGLTFNVPRDSQWVISSLGTEEDGVGELVEDVGVGLVAVVDAARLLTRAVRLDERRHRVINDDLAGCSV